MGHRYEATGVQHAAAGSKRCAAIVLAAEVV
jgi:hypothetical protein